MVKIPLDQEEVNLVKPNLDCQTLFVLAVGFGHEEVLKMLLGREEVNPDNPGHYGQTQLLLPSTSGLRVITLLLTHEALTQSKT